MTHLAEILDLNNLTRHIEAGHIAAVDHPSEPITLYNYTQRCQFAGAWDSETRTCRGLIATMDGDVLARPFPKFHNLHEHGPDSAAGPLRLEFPVQVFDKLDGSLGIAYRRPSDGRLAWATRGSFTSEQACWATDWWDRTYPESFPPDGVTWLAEIIYPENRIVLDYGARSELVLLGGIDNETGQHLCWPDWPGRTVDCFPEAYDLEAVDRNSRPDTEGYVLLSDDGLTRVKLKADEYMRLHKIITGVSNVTIWELLRNGDPIDTLYDKVPDEFAAWAKATVAELEARHAALLDEAQAVHDMYSALLPDRKAYAAEVVRHDCRPIVFAIADGKDAAGLAWKQVRPERALPYFTDPS